MKIGGVWKVLYTQSILPTYYTLHQESCFLFLPFFAYLISHASFFLFALISIFLCFPLSHNVDIMWSDCVGGRPLSLDRLLRTVPFCSGKLGEVTVGSSLEPWRINAWADLGDKKEASGACLIHESILSGPWGAFFHCCPFTGSVEGCCRGAQSCLSQRGCGVIKAQWLGVGQSTQISPSVRHKQRLNGGLVMPHPSVDRY